MEISIFIASLAREFAAERLYFDQVIKPRLQEAFPEQAIQVRHALDEEVLGADAADVLAENLSQVVSCDVFVAFLGARYGQGITSGPAELLEQYPELLQGEVRSGLAHQVRYAVVMRPDRARRCLVMLRDPSYADQLPAGIRQVFEAESERHAAKRKQLVEDVLDSNARSARYRPTWDATRSPAEDLEEFGELAVAMLSDILHESVLESKQPADWPEVPQEEYQGDAEAAGMIAGGSSAAEERELATVAVAEPAQARRVDVLVAPAQQAGSEAFEVSETEIFDVSASAEPLATLPDSKLQRWALVSLPLVLAAVACLLWAVTGGTKPSPLAADAQPVLPGLPAADTVPLPSELATAEQEQTSPSDHVAQWVDLVGRPDEYRQMLQAFLLEHPQHPHSRDWQVVVDRELPVLELLEQRQEWLQQLFEADLRELAPAEAQSRLAAAELHLQRGAQLNGHDRAVQRMAAVEAIAARMHESGRPISDVLELVFNHPVTRPPFVFQTVDGKRFYMWKPPVRESGLYRLEYAVDPKHTTTSRLVGASDIDTQNSGRLNHISMADEVLAILESSDEVGWERAMLSAARSLQAAEKLDPMVHCRWLYAVLHVGARGSLVLKEAFAEHLSVLEQAVPTFHINWLAPSEPKTVAARVTCRQTLEELPGWEAAQRLVEEGLAELAPATPPAGYRWVGLLNQSADGRWYCASRSPLPKEPLHMIRMPDPEGPLQVHVLTADSDGRLMLPDSAEVSRGMPLYQLE